jgi:hypothetical protein
MHSADNNSCVVILCTKRLEVRRKSFQIFIENISYYNVISVWIVYLNNHGIDKEDKIASVNSYFYDDSEIATVMKMIGCK